MRTFLRITFAAGMAMASTMALLLVQTDLLDAGCTLAYLEQLAALCKQQSLLGALLVLCLTVWYSRVALVPMKQARVRTWLVALLFALIAACSATLCGSDESLQRFFEKRHLLLIALKLVGFAAFFHTALKTLLLKLPALMNRWNAASGCTGNAKRVLFISWALILAAWLPSLLARFPGTVTVDAGRALQQYTGEIMVTSDHPVAYTCLIGSVIRLGGLLWNDTFGVALFIALQALFLSGTMAACVSNMARHGVPKAVLCAVTAFYALCPAGMLYVGVIVKDVWYSASMLAYCALTMRLLIEPERCVHKLGWWSAYLLTALMTLLIRHNGVMVVLPMTIVVMAVLLRRKGDRLRALLAVLPLALILLFNQAVVPRVAYQVESTPDVLGIPTQQVARILRDKPQSVTDEELAIIDRLFEADKLAESYRLTSTDGVRKVFRYFNGHTTADTLAYASICLRVIAREPIIALQAFARLANLNVDPFDQRVEASQRSMYQTNEKYPHQLDFGTPEALMGFQDRWFSLEFTYLQLPFVSLLNSVGLYVWLCVLALGMLSLSGRSKRAWLLLIPFLSLVACVFSAGSSFRYALPILYTVPYLLPMLFQELARNAQKRMELA